jgi:hypothetical protein
MNTHARTMPDGSLVYLLRELRDEALLLFRQEVRLAKTEAVEKGSQLGREVVKLAIGGGIALAGGLALIAALCVLAFVGLDAAGLSTGTAAWLGPAIVGTIITAIGAIMLLKARNNIKQMDLAPRETVASLKEDKEWTKEKLTRH